MKILLLATLLAPCVLAAAPKSLDRKAVLEAIAIVEYSEDADAIAEAIPVVLKFADESPDVVLLASPDATPWLTEDLRLPKEKGEMVTAILLGTYASGSVKYQLALGKPDKDPYYGWLPTLKVYRSLKNQLNFICPGLEKLARLQDTGRLKAYGEQLANRKVK